MANRISRFKKTNGKATLCTHNNLVLRIWGKLTSIRRNHLVRILANTIHPPLNNQAHGNPPHHDTPGGHHRNAPPQVPQEYNALVGSSNPYNLAVGSTVQVATINPNDPPHYGVIRWTGRVAGVDGQVAGIELVSKESIV